MNTVIGGFQLEFVSISRLSLVEITAFRPEMGTSALVRVIEQCCFNSVLDPFNGQTVDLILNPPKVIESRTYVKKANLKHY